MGSWWTRRGDRWSGMTVNLNLAYETSWLQITEPLFLCWHNGHGTPSLGLGQPVPCRLQGSTSPSVTSPSSYYPQPGLWCKPQPKADRVPQPCVFLGIEEALSARIGDLLAASQEGGGGVASWGTERTCPRQFYFRFCLTPYFHPAVELLVLTLGHLAGADSRAFSSPWDGAGQAPCTPSHTHAVCPSDC